MWSSVNSVNSYQSTLDFGRLPSTQFSSSSFTSRKARIGTKSRDSSNVADSKSQVGSALYDKYNGSSRTLVNGSSYGSSCRSSWSPTSRTSFSLYGNDGNKSATYSSSVTGYRKLLPSLSSSSVADKYYPDRYSNNNSSVLQPFSSRISDKTKQYSVSTSSAVNANTTKINNNNNNSSSSSSNSSSNAISSIRQNSCGKINGLSSAYYRSSDHDGGDSACSRAVNDRTKESSSCRQSVDENSSSSSAASSKSNCCNGLRNLGNTCFLNSVIQCLSHTADLKTYIVNGKYKRDLGLNESQLLRSFAELLRLLWSERRTVEPSAFWSDFVANAGQFNNYRQHDAHEFLIILLNQLHAQLVSRSTYYGGTRRRCDTLNGVGKRCGLDDGSSKILDMFTGTLKSTVSCPLCCYSCATYEQFWNVSLAVPESDIGSSSLEQLLRNFVKEETLSNTLCNGCKKSRTIKKAYTFYDLPRYVIFHLKRFSSNGARKLKNAIRFPFSTLNMKPYMQSNGIASVRSGGCDRYKLYAIVEHSGSINSGHYTASCKIPGTEIWYKYNDTSAFLQPNMPASYSDFDQPYLLFYEAVDD